MQHMKRGADQLTQFRKGAIELAILALLRDEELYAGDILARLGQRPGLDAPTGTVYPLLARLGRTGLVSTTWRESPVGPPRKYYRLTTTGHDQLNDLTRAWQTLARSLSTLLEER